MKNYFMDFIKYDPVNHFLVLDCNDLIKMKKNMPVNNLKKIKDNLSYLLTEPKYSVLDKDYTIYPEFDIHDYVSLAAYHHPNPDTPDGLPYVRRDGIPNPENDRLDKDKLRNTAYCCYNNLILYYLTEEKKYYEDVKERIYKFFINPETRMNPNMNHAQIIRGINLGRGTGMIDFNTNFLYVLPLFKSLYQLGYIEDELFYGFCSWLKEYMDWVLYSDIALEERDSQNNHGTMYDFLLINLYNMFDMKKEIKSLVYSFIFNRIRVQFRADGGMPLELVRTKSKSYSLMGFKAMTDFAIIAKKYGFDLWKLDSWYYQKLDTSLIEGANFLINRLVKDESKWEGKQIQIFDRATLLPLIYTYYNQTGENNVRYVDLKFINNDVLYYYVDALLK